VVIPVTVFSKCQPNLSLREQPLPPVLVFGADWVRFLRHSSVFVAEDDRRRSIPQLNTEGLTVNKITVIKQLANKNKACTIVLQETHSTTADKLVIPNFPLAGSVLSMKHDLATFVHEQLEWSLVDQSPEQSET